jgi:biofilm PGA synthesis N-glycosyltransferase PgaC
MIPALPEWIVYPILFVGFFMAFFYLIVFLKKEEKIPKATRFPDVSFVIPVRNAEICIERCILDIIKQDYPGKINIVVVNDASTDTTREIAKRLAGKYNSSKRRIIIVDRKKSQGKKAPVLNEGIRYVLKNLKTEITCPIDADTFITKNVLINGVSYFEKDERIAAVITPLIPMQTNFLLRLQYVEYVMSNFFRELLGKANALSSTPAFTLFRTSFFKEAGLYNEHSWTEDFDMALKVKANLYRIAYLKDKVYFIAPENLKKLRVERVRWGHGTFQALFKDYPYLLSPKYGATGTFFLPVTVFVGIGLLMISLLLLIYGFFHWAELFIHNLIVGWKPSFNIGHLDLNTVLFQVSVFLSDSRVLLGIFGILISVIFFVFARNYSKERIRLIDYLIFFVPYVWFLAYTQLEGFIKYVFKMKMTWGYMHKKHGK